MTMRTLYRLAAAGFLLLILASVVSAVAASNTVPPSRLADRRSAIDLNSFKPAACSALTLTRIVVCSGTGNCNGTAGNDLILGSANADTIKGTGGSDCILGGGGDDDISGSGGGDVCIGGPGTDTFKQCETGNQ
jgi:hemolysin type calcium-binding protein